ncbi:hypothetical protein SAMN05444161_6824 [Rhizobiales bacterium GAS191]|nr:hypothetical protein SAMN05444161_6824 [Rhizobiales bacterium GAS191]
MRGTAILTILMAMFGSHAAVADVKRHKSIPESVWESWAPSPEGCKTAKSVIVLSAKTYISPDTNCTVAWVSKTAGPRGSFYSAHLLCSKPDEKARNTQSNVIFMSKGENQISVGPMFDDLKDYQRCSTKE